MTLSVDLALIRMNESIRKSKASCPVFLANSRAGRVAVAQNMASLMEAMSSAYAEAMIDLAGQCESLTGAGDLSEAATFRELVAEDASEYLITAIRQGADGLEEDLQDDPNAEHRLTARDYGIGCSV